MGTAVPPSDAVAAGAHPPRPHRWGLPLLALSLAALVSACRDQTPDAGGSSPGTAAGSAQVTPDLVARYGYGPRHDPSVTYQPDVVLVGDGPAAIRRVSADGLTWSMDARAPGIDRLSPGKVMFASSLAVGRVLKRERKGDVVNVTLAPVALGEVLRDAHIVLDRVVSLDSLVLSEVPQLPDAYEDEVSSELTSSTPAGHSYEPLIRTPTVILAVARPSVSGRREQPLSATGASEKSTKVGDWTLSAYRTSGALGLRAERGVASAGKPVEGADLKVAIDAHIEVSDLRVVADIPVTRGEVGTSHFRVYGINGVSITAQGGAVNGLSDNRKIKIEIPIELRQPVIIGGFPAMLTQKFKFLVHTAFTAKNGNITAQGEWDVDGSIGIDGQTVTIPKMTAREGKHLIDNLQGVSIGVNGIVVGVSFQFGLVIGLPVAGAGPAASFITSLGLTNGSSLGIVQCKQVSITSVVSAGVAVQAFDPVKKALKALLGYDLPAEKPVLTRNILQENWVKPNVVACR